MDAKGRFVLATYQVSEENQEAVLELLREVEDVMRTQGLITEFKAIRMRSKGQPELILEVFEWVDDEAFVKAQQDSRVTSLWSKLGTLWEDGGFGVSRFPESNEFWAQLDSLN